MLIHPVILSGGSGTRLWPLSRSLRPKQLLPLVTEKSMLQETVLRVSGDGFAAPIVICNHEHRFLAAEQLREIDAKVRALVLEPEGRNTAPAITIAALMLAQQEANAIMLVLPSDHIIGDPGCFGTAVSTAAAAAKTGALITFGIRPDVPATGYGYIQSGAPLESIDGCFHVTRFVEKPDLETAKQFLEQGNYLWNSGMFVLPVAPYLTEIQQFAPALLSLCS